MSGARSGRARSQPAPLETQNPASRVDFDWLGGLNLTGGSIHNIALNASFLVAAAGAPKVTMEMVLQAARQEFRKMQRPVNEADFRWPART